MSMLPRSGCLVLAITAMALGSCEPPDEPPPPATAQNYAGVPPPPSGPPAQSVGTPGASPAYGAANAGEYAIGEEADSYDDRDPSSLTDFRAALDAHGTWVDDPNYGTVWVPATAEVGADFRPYVTAGHWTYDGDWVWVSDYDWGWAAFHYGRWIWLDGRGWVWVPGRVYRGAWVTWSVTDDYGYVGWAPAPLEFVWFGGAAVTWGGGYIQPRWAYCPRREVFTPTVGTRVIVGVKAAPIVARAHLYVAAGTGAAAGPAPQRLGYSESQLPHPTGAAQARIARAQQFSRPSTAVAVGAQPPWRASAQAATAQPGQQLPSGATRANETAQRSGTGASGAAAQRSPTGAINGPAQRSGTVTNPPAQGSASGPTNVPTVRGLPPSQRPNPVRVAPGAAIERGPQQSSAAPVRQQSSAAAPRAAAPPAERAAPPAAFRGGGTRR